MPNALPDVAPVAPVIAVAPDVHDVAADPTFPVLTSAQIARIAVHGRRRPVERGEVLSEPGIPNTRFFVITAGRIEVLRRANDVESVVTVHAAGQFTGEVNMLSGRQSLVTV